MLTSLKLMIRPLYQLAYLVSTYTLLLMAFVSSAFETNDQALQVHGFVAQGVIDASGSNYINTDETISLELTEIGLNASYQIGNDFRVAGQAVYLNGGNRYHEGVRLDYLLLEWNAFHNESWQANIYLGRVKNDHWLYSSTRDIPFARPSILIPQVVYFDSFRDIAVGGDGAALKLSYNNDVIGEVDLNFSRGKSNISSDQVDVVMGKFALGKIDHELDTQASIYWRPPYSQWQFGLSALDSTFTYKSVNIENFFDGEFVFQFYTANALYEGEFWQLSAEIFQERFVTDGFYFPGFHRDETGQGFYLQGKYKLDDDLTLILRHERFYANKNDKNGSKLEQSTGGLVPSYFGFHNNSVLGLSYDLADNMRISAEYHWVEGAARLAPVLQPDPIANDSKNWQVWTAQFMYWF